MAEFWENDAVEKQEEPFWKNDHLAQPDQSSPTAIPPAFIDRLQKGERMRKALDAAAQNLSPDGIPFSTAEQGGEVLGRVAQAAGRGAAEGYGDPTPTGLSDDTLRQLTDLTIFHDPTKGSPTPLQFMNEAIILPLAGAFDRLVRGANAGLYGAAEALDQIHKELGGDEQDHRLKRDVINFGNWAMIESGFGRFSRPSPLADHPVGSLPTKQDFKLGAEAIGGGEAEANLQKLWQEKGIHPAEAANDAERDAFLKHDLTSPPRVTDAQAESAYQSGLTGEKPIAPKIESPSASAQDILSEPPNESAHFTRVQDGQRFVVNDKSSPDLAVMPEVNGVAEAPIRLRRSDLRHIDEPLHRAAAVGAGYSDGLHLTLDTLENWTEIRAASDGRIMLVRPLEEHNAVAVTELERSGGSNFWRVVTSGLRSDEKLGEVLKVREPTPESASGEQTPLIHRTKEASGTGESAQGLEGDGNISEGGKPRNLGAAANTEPPMTPLSEQPASAPGKLSASVKAASDKLYDIGRDAQMLVAPMATGTRDSMAIAKDFANTMRRNRWDWNRIDHDVVNSKELKAARDRIGETAQQQRERMWNAADEESVMRQSGEKSENMGLATLQPEERAMVEELQSRAQNAWLRARDLEMVEGEGLPAYTPRMLINATEAGSGDGAISLNGIGHNLKVSSPGMKRRSYLTAEETEAAAKKVLGEGAQIARDIRSLPLATAKLEDAIAGRQLINAIKEYGKRTGSETVAEGAIPAGAEGKWFTLDHPAFRTWRPKLEKNAEGKWEAVKDANGNEIFEQTPLFVHGDFEGPLKSVLTEKNGPLYSALMDVKGKTMSLIMNSPLIHNAVEWGRALPAMPGKVATFKIYFEGNRFKNNVPEMQEAIQNGLVPIGHRFFKQDISSIMEEPNMTPGRSWTAKVLGAVPGLFDEAAGNSVKAAIDKAGDFWHNTLLWDRVGDLQAGLYANFRDDLMAKGLDRTTASRVAAHFANRYAGSLPTEAMSNGARKLSNLLMFSRTFTLGNVGAIKDMLTGLPKDVLAQIERDAGFKSGALSEIAKAGEEAAKTGAEAAQYAKTMAKRKAMSVIALDIGLFYVGNSILQNGLNVMLMDSTLDKEMHGYVQRLQAKLAEVKEHPLSLLHPLNLLEDLSATGEHEPGRKDRLLVGHTKDGTAIYARNPAGKIGEEFIGYMTGPLDMMRRKLGTLARPAWQILSNDKGFGRKVYDPDADTGQKYVQNAVNIAKVIVQSQLPTGQLNAGSDLVKGEGDPTLNKLQTFGPLAGFTFSKGAPGGPAVGELYHARSQHDYQVQLHLPDIQRQFLRGDRMGATQQMTELGIPAGLQRYYFRVWQNPATRLSPKNLKDFYLYATPAQRERLERFRAQ